MISDRRRVRLRTALDEWFVVVVVALLALALLGGWGAYGAVADDGDEEFEQRTVEAWSTTGGFDHSATVQEENEVFPVGTELSDRSMYFAEVAPELEATFTYAYDAPDGDVAVDVEADRVIRSVGETDDEEEEVLEYWATNETLAQEETESLAPGEEQTTSFSVDVPETTAEAEAIQEDLNESVGDLETVVEVQVALEGTIDGESVDRVDSYELVIEPDDATYAVEAPAAEERTEERTEEVAVAGSSGGLSSVVLALLGVGSVAALGVLGVARRKGTLAPSAAELERINDQYEREEFDDWISRGRLPAEVRERSRIEIATLEDLVDVAVDCDRRVLEDERDGRYYVVDDRSVYVYVPEGLEDDRNPVLEVDPQEAEEPTVIGDGSGEESGLEDESDDVDS
ncbi:DUF5305 domain-containing protein [Natronococcus sp. A-GB1]|uniref:DUF5305 domain-containing protein n=1 Tax=Natronococcus sp. A-GB1 TaxID=3037648 RepID=UPI00241DE1A0|nr:DUF5305 domain-containing protein [Natronococcus sp. A-GB1]MDG5759178.1 DUF5305 domain-containing protein [Natronococcus sp. A-GB1]